MLPAPLAQLAALSHTIYQLNDDSDIKCPGKAWRLLTAGDFWCCLSPMPAVCAPSPLITRGCGQCEERAALAELMAAEAKKTPTE